MSDKLAEQWRLADEEVRKNLPPGVKLVRTLRGHTDWIGRIAWSPDGRMLASPSKDGTIRLWGAETGESLRTLSEHMMNHIPAFAFDPVGRTLASGGDKMITLRDPVSGKLLRTFEGHTGNVLSVAFDPAGRTLVFSFQNNIAIF